MDIKLTPFERDSAVWKKLKKGLEERLEALRKKNDFTMSESDTAKLRGRIAEIKFLLDLDNPKPAIPEVAAE